MPRVNADGERVDPTTDRSGRPADSGDGSDRRTQAPPDDDDDDADATPRTSPSTVRRARRGGNGDTDDRTASAEGVEAAVSAASDNAPRNHVPISSPTTLTQRPARRQQRPLTRLRAAQLAVALIPLW
jgi:hypothetical protein